ncbi:RNA cytosine-C(5)-methyltransferase NSUN2-like [Apostichopus japonicus]|uniref:RNA cytosine-C(5)-methyltransferase NSUN2-like n=1 Tax=Stichopus japonicus TaxID=307972 RepID=UPI003AB41055
MITATVFRRIPRRTKCFSEMGRNRKNKKKNSGWGEKQDRRGYAEIIKENKTFENYYKEQNIIPIEEWEAFMSALKKPLPATFRITGFRGQAEQVLEFVKGNYINNLVTKTQDGDVIDKPYPLPWYPDEAAWQLNHDRQILRKVPALEKLHKFLVSETDSGNISRQELVSMIPPLLLDVKSDHLVLDMCAAPGSKTAQIIEALHADESDKQPEGVVIGNDSDNKRCYIMVHQAKRLNSPCCMVVNHDARFFPKLFFDRPDGKKEQLMYDRILCDVPCSGDGTMRKNTMIWKQWAQTSAISLHNLQKQILHRGTELLAVGGKLVYSTCSFNPIENEAVVSSVLIASEGALQLADVSGLLPGLKRRSGLKSWKVINETPQEYAKPEDVPEKKRRRYIESMWPPSEEDAERINLHRCVRIVPHDQNSGGFFVAVLEKVKRLPNEKEPIVKTVTEVQSTEDTTVSADSTEVTVKDTDVIENAATSSVDEDIADTISTEDAVTSVTPTDDASTEGISEPPQKKVKTERSHFNSFKEDPFNYFDGEEELWPEIKKFYKIDDAFPITQMLTRSFGGKKRNLYYTNKRVKQIILTNQQKLKVINSGIKTLCRSDAEGVDCSFRLSQEGIISIFPFMSDRKVLVEQSDVIKLMSTECPFDYTFSEKMQTQLKTFGQGSIVFVCDPEITDLSQASSKSLIIVGWKGKTSVRSYLDKNSRQHYLRMCGGDVSQSDALSEKQPLETVSRDASGDGPEQDDRTAQEKFAGSANSEEKKKTNKNDETLKEADQGGLSTIKAEEGQVGASDPSEATPVETN